MVLTGVHPEAPANWRHGMTFTTPVSETNAYAGSLIQAALNRAPLAHYDFESFHMDLQGSRLVTSDPVRSTKRNSQSSAGTFMLNCGLTKSVKESNICRWRFSQISVDTGGGTSCVLDILMDKVLCY